MGGDYHRLNAAHEAAPAARDTMPSTTASPASPPAVLELIGNTPLVEVTRFDTGPCALFLKLESQNPGGSIKDRIGVAMIEAAERDGRLRARRHGRRGDRRQHRPRPGAGRARQGLSRRPRRARQDGDREGAAPEGAGRRGAHHALRRRQGPPRLLPGHRRARSRATIPGAFFADQFNNPANPLRARDRHRPRDLGADGPRRRRDRRRRRLGGHADRADALLPRRAAASSSSCSPTRSARSSPSTRAAARSATAGSWAVEGIGEDFIPAIADLSGVRAAYSIADEESFGTARELLQARGHPRRLVDRHAARRRAALLPRADRAEARRQLRLRHRHALSLEGLQRPLDDRPGPARAAALRRPARPGRAPRRARAASISVDARRHPADRVPAHAPGRRVAAAGARRRARWSA